MTNTSGPLIILSGPAGSGKTTLVRRLVADSGSPLRVAVTATTRAPREGESDGKDYHFWTPERFESAIRNNELLESAEVHGRRYGTPRSEVEPYRAQGIGVLLVIDVVGTRQVKRVCSDALTIFLRAPSGEEAERRLRDRGSEDEAAIARRLETARLELASESEYDHVVVNENLEDAVATVRGLLDKRFLEGRSACSTN